MLCIPQSERDLQHENFWDLSLQKEKLTKIVFKVQYGIFENHHTFTNYVL